MTDHDRFEDHLAASLTSRVVEVRAPIGVAAAARTRWRRRRARTAGVTAAVVGVAVVAVAAAVLRPSDTAGPSPAEQPSPTTAQTTAPFAPCADGALPDTTPATTADLADLAAGGAAALCRYTNPSTGDPYRDTRDTLTDQVQLTPDQAAALAGLVDEAEEDADPCAMIDSPPPVSLVVTFETDDGPRSLSVPEPICLGFSLADDGSSLASGPVVAYLGGFLPTPPGDGLLTGTVTMSGGPPGAIPSRVSAGTVHVEGEGVDLAEPLAPDGSFALEVPAGVYDVYARSPQYNDGARCVTLRVRVASEATTPVEIGCLRR